MSRKGGLGRGLGSLLPIGERGEDSSVYRELPLTSISPNLNQPRKAFDEESLNSLSASIAAIGVLQPILVRVVSDNSYEIIAGERRFRAAKRAGLDRIPALVQSTDELGSLERAVVENLHRQDLNPLEEASAYQQLIEDFGLTHETLALRMGKSRVSITNSLRILQLPPSILGMIAQGLISAGHARALLGSPDRIYQEKLARRIVDEGLSVRLVEEEIRKERESITEAASADGAQGRRKVDRASSLKPAVVLELEEILEDLFSTRVKVDFLSADPAMQRGKVVIEFASLEDLERIYKVIMADTLEQE
ncbi:MAG: ParB/RepB/Spo0J family partition protein [Acidimicrobiaceae bacterium]|nr:ParB/RepB/Spo0J family partition protein [Acidimicrobiaceae bacterium]